MPQSMLSILLLCAVFLEYRCEDYVRSACSSIYNPLDPECGKDNLEASEDPQNISSPQSQDIKEGYLRSCVWRITAKSGFSISLTVLNVEYNQGSDCWPNSLKVYVGNDTDYPRNEILSLCSSQGRKQFHTEWSELTIVFQVHQSFNHSKFQLQYKAYYRPQVPLPRIVLSFDRISSCDNSIPSEGSEKHYQNNTWIAYDWETEDKAEVLIYYCVHPKSPVSHHLLWSESPDMARRWRTECNDTLCRVHCDNLNPPLSGNYVFYVRSGRASARISIQVKLENTPEMYTPTNAILPNQNGYLYRLDCYFLGDPVPDGYWFSYPANRIKDCLYASVPNISDWSRFLLETLNKQNKMKGRDGEFKSVCNQSDYLLSLSLTAADSGCLICWSPQEPNSGSEGGIEFQTSEEEALVDEKFSLTCSANSFNFAKLYWAFRKDENGKAIPGNQLEDKDRSITSKMSSINSTLTLRVLFARISEEHEGTYICTGEQTIIVERKLDRRTTKSAKRLKVAVHSGPAFVGNTSNVRNDVQHVKVEEDSGAVLNCSARGKRPLTYEWIRIETNGNQVPFESKSSGTESERDFVQVDYSETEQTKAVVCIVKNDNGNITRQFDFERKKDGSNHSQETEKIIYIASAGIIFLLTTLGAAIMIWWWRTRKNGKKPKFIFLTPKLSGPLEVNIPLDIAWEFPDQRLRLGEKIGHGAFGRVVKAEAFGICPNEDVTTVAVKMLKSNADASHKKALFEELKILIRLGRHLNVVNLFGAVTKYQSSGRLMIIVEYCEKGNLLQYLHKHRKNFVCQVHKDSGKLDKSLKTLPFQNNQGAKKDTSENTVSREKWSDTSASVTKSSEASSSYKKSPDESTDPDSGLGVTTDPDSGLGVTTYPDSGLGVTKYPGSGFDVTTEPPLTSYDLVKFSFQCSRGLEYIESRKLVHRDLSARNVLLTQDNIIKICDFGLTREEVYLENNQTKGALPIRWMAPESLGQNQFTTKSDIWSFGILLWEMFTLGDTPYAGMTIDHEFYKKIFTGYRLDPPETTPRQLSSVMQNCWQTDPDARPCVSEIVGDISELLNEQEKNYYMVLNAPYQAAQRNSRELDNMETDDDFQLDALFDMVETSETSETEIDIRL